MFHWISWQKEFENLTRDTTTTTTTITTATIWRTIRHQIAMG